ncbi:unnamed protein product [Meloidogyne enterolobii]|uniref:Uncharacterized protein n=1 Tax=Meloidogyne enterolobii TaxID=390850 RepID=A0ACB0ZC89_MELEN
MKMCRRRNIYIGLKVRCQVVKLLFVLKVGGAKILLKMGGAKVFEWVGVSFMYNSRGSGQNVKMVETRDSRSPTRDSRQKVGARDSRP